MMSPFLLLLLLHLLGSVSGIAFPPGQISVFESLYPKQMPPPVTLPWEVCGRDIKIIRHRGENEFLPEESLLRPCTDRIEASKKLLGKLESLQFPAVCDPKEMRGFIRKLVA